MIWLMVLISTYISGLLGPTAASLSAPSTPNSLLNALNSSISPLHVPSSGTPSPTLWSNSLASPTSTPGVGKIHTHTCTHHFYQLTFFVVKLEVWTIYQVQCFYFNSATQYSFLNMKTPKCACLTGLIHHSNISETSQLHQC